MALFKMGLCSLSRISLTFKVLQKCSDIKYFVVICEILNAGSKSRDFESRKSISHHKHSRIPDKKFTPSLLRL